MTVSGILSFKSICQALAIEIPHTVAQFIWSAVAALWPWYWFLILVAFIAWIAFEIATRNGIAHYNSDNGFSPVFNSFVGVITYASFQALVYFLSKLIFSDLVYCMPWPYALHLIVFLSTGLFLHTIGFWPRLELPERSRHFRGRRRLH